MLVWLRNAIYLVLLAAAVPWLFYRAVRLGKPPGSLRQKMVGAAGPQSSASPLIWLHGVSVGEVQLLKPLVDALAAKQPQAAFAVSTTTETGMDLARSLFAESGVRLFFFPLDFSWAIRRVFSRLRPSIIVLGELELWPNLIDIAHQEDVPIVVVNGRLSQRSFQGYRKLGWLTRPMFAKLRWVAAQNTSYAERFIACGTPSARVTTSGSFKFDNVSFRRDAPSVLELKELAGIKEQRVWVVGSTQAPEELYACQAFIKARVNWPQLRMILVPRHRERFAEVAHMLESLPVRWLRRSLLSRPADASQWEVLLVDTIGELRWWWGLADMALVGGSFGKRGGQNMLEPAAYGVNIAFGPNTENFRDIAQLLLDAQAAERIATLEDIHDWLISQLQDPEPGIKRGENAQRCIARQQGALDRTVDYLSQLLEEQADEPRRKSIRLRERQPR